MAKLMVVVSKEDWDAAEAEREVRMRCAICPIAQAVRRTHPNTGSIWVSVTTLFLGEQEFPMTKEAGLTPTPSKFISTVC